MAKSTQSQAPEKGVLDRWLAPRAALSGIVCAFVLCCGLGRFVSGRPLYRDFLRFHREIAPEGLYYPTACQVKKLLEDEATPEQTLVVIGGNSILYGFGQRAKEVWTRKLQDLLGSRYRVVNLAMCGAGTTEFAGVAVEMIARKHPKVIFVTNHGLCDDADDPSYLLFRYFFWDALHKGLLPDDDEHRNWVTHVRSGRTKDTAFPELDLQMQVDAAVYSRDLWTALAYEKLSTVWNPIVANSWNKARRCYTDSDLGATVPFSQRCPPALDDAAEKILRLWLKVGEPVLRGPHPTIVTSLQAAVPQSSRARTLVLFFQESPHYVGKLPPMEQEKLRGMYDRGARLIEEAGIPAMAIGDDWQLDDFYDRCHVSEVGAAKLAAVVAPKVREIASRLGYLNEDDDGSKKTEKP